jgi:hypothetical protein
MVSMSLARDRLGILRMALEADGVVPLRRLRPLAARGLMRIMAVDAAEL